MSRSPSLQQLGEDAQSKVASDSNTRLESDEKPIGVVSQAQPVLPDGGLQAWCTVLGGFLIQFCCGGYSISFGVYQDFYVREYLTNSTPSAISWIGSLNACLLISGGVVAGRLYDRGYFYSLLYGGSFLTIFSLFMLSLAKPNQYYQIFLSQGIGAGLGGGLTYIPSVAITAQYFSKKRALAMALITAGGSVGTIVHPIMLNNTLSRLGFGNAVRASAGLVAGLLVIACCLMRTRTTTRKQPAGNSKAMLKAITTDYAYVAATAGLMLFSIGLYFPQFYIQLDATKHDLNETFVFYSLVILNFANLLGRIIPSLLANILGVENMVTASAFACAAVILGMIGLSSIASVVLIALVYGFVSGAFISLSNPLLVLLTSNMSELGLRMGIAYFFSGIAGLIGTPIGGALLTKEFIWWRPALFSGLTCLAGGAFYVVMLVLLRRRKLIAGETHAP
ncbi:hypothetical protein E1B28_006593 [Marasmius oreades]|uniref:Major facilitator superfamily (MFS) profile domain-containing protein n=1 Tax=Marasmius oreades TaxID=181124 RepID=A0A9P8A9E4_9AGAR|nr:uncharacterized protein E1B28_006593 [Marasmius oreades]KAG7095906.1 hypothetical protein E1B28_006593 [Marasmius oreades]